MPTMAAQTGNHTTSCLVILLIQLGLHDAAINGVDDQVLQDKRHNTHAQNFNTVYMSAELGKPMHAYANNLKSTKRMLTE